MLELLKEKENIWDYLVRDSKPIAVYGMGNGAEKIISTLESYGAKVDEIFASDEFVRGHSFLGYKVKKYSDICREYDDFNVVLAFATHLDNVLENIKTNWRGLTGTISLSTDKFLCLAIPYMDGWKAYVDGEEVKLYQANTAFMGVELLAGNHEVELRYWLPGLTVGIILSGIGVICLFALVIYQIKSGK